MEWSEKRDGLPQGIALWYARSMQSKATSVEEYLAGLPEDRRAALGAVRDVIRGNLDRDYAEGMQYGMIGYYVPRSVFPPGYHSDPSQPLPFACLAAQKNHMALYLMSVVDEGGEGARFRQAWRKSGKKLDMGKSCIRFRRLEDLALDVIGDAIRRMPARTWIETYLRATAGRKPTPRKEIAARVSAKASAKKASAKKATAKKASSARVSRARASSGSPSTSRARSTRRGRG